MPAAPTERVRLRGGRLTHAVVYRSGHVDRHTACGKNAEDGEFLDETPVTCTACNRTA